MTGTQESLEPCWGGVGGNKTTVEGRVPEGSVCSVKNRNPRISTSAMLVTQFLLSVGVG